MKTKTFDCIQFQRKTRDVFFKESEFDVKKLWLLLNDKNTHSEFVKLFKEKNQIK